MQSGKGATLDLAHGLCHHAESRMSNFLPTDSQAAKQFLLDRLLEQSQRDGVELSDIEKRMFLFSESSGETDWEANQRFEAEYNDTQYEAKIAKFLRHSYADAKKIHRRDCCLANGPYGFAG